MDNRAEFTATFWSAVLLCRLPIIAIWIMFSDRTDACGFDALW
jgi:hypothetical protein